MGDVLIKPLSALRVRLPLTRTSQEPPPDLKPIQQQLEYLAIRKTVDSLVELIFDNAEYYPNHRRST